MPDMNVRIKKVLFKVSGAGLRSDGLVNFYGLFIVERLMIECIPMSLSLLLSHPGQRKLLHNENTL